MLLETPFSLRILGFFLCLNLSLSYAQSELTTAEIETINTNQSATSGDLYLDVQRDELYLGLDTGGLRKISNKEVLVDDLPLPEVVNPIIYLDTSSSQTDATSYVTVKSFMLPADILKSQNAVKIIFYKRRISTSGSVQIQLVYGGQTLFTTGNLGNAVGRVEMILFATGSPTSQRAYIDDANTGNNGQRTGVATVDSSQEQLVEIKLRTSTTAATFSLDFLSAEGLIFD